MKKHLNHSFYTSAINKLTQCILGTVMLLLSVLTMANAQETTGNKIQADLEAYSQQHLQEKLFLHVDKNVYLSNEICWFKIYNVDAFFHHPLGISKIAYVELLDAKNRAVVQTKINLSAGEGDGSFQIPATITTGNYVLRAYTNWMKNSSANFFFEKAITIINTLTKSSSVAEIKKEERTIRFFPEGGNLVHHIQSTIAFHVTNQYGKGLDAAGIIVNEKNETITNFNTTKLGIGRFDFQPDTAHQYKAIINFADGSILKQDLPTIYANGMVLHLEDKNNQLKLSVQSSQKSNDIIYLLVHTRGIVKKVQSLILQNGNAEFMLDKNELGDGIATFTLFDQQKQPICERLFFKQPSQTLDLGVKIESSEYEFRKKVNVQINSNNEAGAGISANLSMAVYKIDSLQSIDAMDIRSYLLISADLADAVEMASSYFNTTDANNALALDNLMLTHGWRRFIWENILANKKTYFEFLPEYAGHFINGKINNKTNGSNLKDKAVFVSVPGLHTQFRSTSSNESGNIKFEMKDFYNKGQIVVQLDSIQKNTSTIEIASPFSNKFSNKILLTPIVYDQMSTTSLSQHHVANLVLNNYKNADLNKFNVPTLDTNAFYSHPDRIYLLDNFVRFTTLEEVIREYVTPLSLTKSNGRFHLNVYDEENKQFFDGPPLVLLDGVFVPDLNKLIEYDPLKIRKLEVVSRTYYLGNLSFNGIANFSTYNGKTEGYEYDPSALVLDYEGLQQQRQFSAPLYENQKEIDNRLPDFRNLLFWQPTITTSATGNKSLSFYTSDIAGKYVIVLQGMTKDGQLGVKHLEFEVKGH